jgi:hypothetical protein
MESKFCLCIESAQKTDHGPTVRISTSHVMTVEKFVPMPKTMHSQSPATHTVLLLLPHTAQMKSSDLKDRIPFLTLQDPPVY